MKILLIIICRSCDFRSGVSIKCVSVKWVSDKCVSVKCVSVKWVSVKCESVKWVSVKWLSVKWLSVKWRVGQVACRSSGLSVKWLSVKWLSVKRPRPVFYIFMQCFHCITLHRTHAKDTQIQYNIYFHLNTKILLKLFNKNI
jgi:hypothetical protein